jgi:hypothetical protein
VPSPIRQSGSSAAPRSNSSPLTFNDGSSEAHAVPGSTVLSLEFVATPQKAAIASTAIPPAIQAAFEEVTSFAGCLVMASDQEPRLITVFLLWKGSEGRQRCAQSVRSVRALLAPYMDRCLRVQTLAANSALLWAEAHQAGAGFLREENPMREESAFVV